MKKALTTLAFAGVVLAPAAALAAPSVSFAGGSGVMTPGTTVFENFNSFTAGDPIGPNAFALNGTDGSGARPAYGSDGNYASVLTGGSYTTTFAATSVFSFVLGSLDTYNTLTLLLDDGTSQNYIGGQIINDLSFPSGNQISGETNGVVTYSAGAGPKIVGAVFTSSANSFEFDNLAAGVPEPATWALMIVGFGAVGSAMRRRSAQPSYAI